MKIQVLISAVCALTIWAGCLSRQTTKTGNDSMKKGQIEYSGGGGDSYETAIVIKGTQYNKKPEDAVAAEYDYISGLYGKKDKDWIVEEQSIVKENDKTYDMVRVKILTNGRMHFFYFDITYFSKKPKPKNPEE